MDKETEDIGNARTGLSKIRTFESFQTPAYSMYYGSMAANYFAMNMLVIVRFLLIFRLSGSPGITGALALANAIPTLIMALIGGTLADRMPKKILLIIGRAGLAILALVIAILLSTGYLSADRPGSWWILIITAVFEGGLNGIIWPTNMSIVPEIVSKERVMNAIFLSTMGQNVFKLLSPAIAGFLIDAVGFSADYYFMTGLYVIALIFTLFLPRVVVTTKNKGNLLEDTMQGLRHLGRDTGMLLIILFTLCHVVSGHPFNQLLPVFTDTILKISASKLGLLTSVSAVGALIFSLAFASFPMRRRGLLLLTSGIVMGIPVIIFTFVHQWWVSLLMMAFIGLGQTMHGGFASTLVQTYADPNYRSRMQSFIMVGSSLAGFGTFGAGMLAEIVGIQTAIGGFAVFLTVITFIFIIFGTRLRKMD